jgi:hypothetical protein
MDTFVVTFTDDTEQAFRCERVVTAGEGDRMTVHLFPNGPTEQARLIKCIHRLVYDRTGEERLQPWWPEREGTRTNTA